MLSRYHFNNVFTLQYTSFLLIIVFFVPILSHGQNLDLSADFHSSFGSDSYQAFWLTRNQHGKFDEFAGNGFVDLSGKYNTEFGEIKVSSEVELLLGMSRSNGAFLQQGYAAIDYKFLQIIGGRFSKQIGESTKSPLSSGSLFISENAPGIPQIKVGIPEFTPLPFLQGAFKIKGDFSHGWFEDSRQVKNAMYHQKTFYLGLSHEKLPFRAGAGILHMAQWAGTTPDGFENSRSFDDFLRVITIREGNQTANIYEQINKLGNHYGMTDYYIDLLFKQSELSVYWQHPFEDKSGLVYRNLPDGIWGTRWKRQENQIVEEVLYEFIYTRDQTGPGTTDRTVDFPDEESNFGFRFNGRDNYYNNYMYSDGLTYLNTILGTPLFMTRDHLEAYLPGENPFSALYIISNRILAHHVGFSGSWKEKLHYQTKITFQRHSGTYQGYNLNQPWGSRDPNNDLTVYVFTPPLDQWSLFFEPRYDLDHKYIKEIGMAFAWDFGQIMNTAGVRFSVKAEF